MEGRELKANEFSFVLKDSTGKVVETVKNDASGNVKFLSSWNSRKVKKGVKLHIEEVKGSGRKPLNTLKDPLPALLLAMAPPQKKKEFDLT